MVVLKFVGYAYPRRFPLIRGAVHQESCRFGTGIQDIRRLGPIAQELMQGFVREDGILGVHDLERWPVDSRAVNFLSETTSAGSLDGLRQVSIP